MIHLAKNELKATIDERKMKHVQRLNSPAISITARNIKPYLVIITNTQIGKL